MFRLRVAAALSALVAVAQAAPSSTVEGLAKGVRFRSFGVEEGLSNETVYSLAQDSTGFLWVGAEEGLNRYDGYRFDVFAHDPLEPTSLSEEDVSAVLVDSRGQIWVATWGGGVNLFDARSDSFVRIGSHEGELGALRDNRVQSLFEDRKGNLWIGTYSGGMSRLAPDTRSFVHYHRAAPAPQRLSDDRVWAICEDTAGELWVGTDNGLNRLSSEGVVLQAFGHEPGAPSSLPDPIIRAVAAASSGELWIGTETGMCRLDAARSSCKPAPTSGPDAHILAAAGINEIREGRDGRIWVGTYGRGLFVLDQQGGVLSHHVHDPANPWSLPHDDVRAVYEDPSGVLWLGTRGGGLSAVDLKPPKFVHVAHDPDNPSSLGHRSVWAILEDRSGTLWVASWSRGLDRLEADSGEFIHYRADPSRPASLRSDMVDALYQGPSGVMWLGTWGGGLSRYRPHDDGFFTYRHDPADPQSLSDDRVRDMVEDPDGRLWVATVQGLNLLDPETGRCQRFFNHSGEPSSLSDSFVRIVFVDSSETLWVGTDTGGLNRFHRDSGSFERYQRRVDDERSLSHDRVTCILESSRGELWVGTANGLNRFDRQNGLFTRITEDDDLANDFIKAMLEDRSGRLWLSTNRGLIRYDVDAETSRAYSPSDGLQGNVFVPNAASHGAGGRLYFGGLHGYNVFVPEDVRDNPRPPPVVLRTFKRFGEPMRFDRPLHEVERIELEYTDNFFTIEFAALDFTDPARNRFTYRLEGFDKGWVSLGTRAEASYTNVPPGSYVFRVKACNNDGVWNETGAAVQIVITPPFWETWWFRLLALAVAATAAASLYQLRVRTITAQKKRLELTVAERTSELRTQRDHLERINRIVKSINSEVSFAALLGAILEQMQIIDGVDRASALVLDKEAHVFRFAAASGWPLEQLVDIQLTPDEAVGRYLAGSEEIFEDIFVAKQVEGRAAEEKFGSFALPLSMMIMRVRVNGEIEGYLVFSNLHREDAFDDQDVLLLENLKEHILSAFLKMRVLTELERLNETKNEFLGIAAHDLRNPLGLISAWTSITIRHIQTGRFTTERGIRDLNRVVAVAEQMNRLVAELLDISAIESGKLNLELAAENLQNILEECRPLYSRIAEEKGITLDIDATSPLPPVLVDRTRVFEVLDNLLSNAIKYTAAGGRIRVTGESTNGDVIIHISDSGQGLNEDDLKVIFRSFKRLSAKPTGGEPSTGLGLAIVKKIVELHGGRIWVESEQGVGSTFSFSLPAAV